jgi:hypothetical protein
MASLRDNTGPLRAGSPLARCPPSYLELPLFITARETVIYLLMNHLQATTGVAALKEAAVC